MDYRLYGITDYTGLLRILLGLYWIMDYTGLRIIGYWICYLNSSVIGRL